VVPKKGEKAVFSPGPLEALSSSKSRKEGFLFVIPPAHLLVPLKKGMFPPYQEKVLEKEKPGMGQSGKDWLTLQFGAVTIQGGLFSSSFGRRPFISGGGLFLRERRTLPPLRSFSRGGGRSFFLSGTLQKRRGMCFKRKNLPLRKDNHAGGFY